MPKIVDHEAVKRHILEQCFGMFAKEGYEKLTMRKIAETLKISTGTLYHYFRNKEELFMGTLEAVGHSKMLELNSYNRKGMSLSERLDRLFLYISDNETFFIHTLAMIYEFYKFNHDDTYDLKWMNVEYRRLIEQFLVIPDAMIVTMIFEYINGVINQRMVYSDMAFMVQTNLFREMFIEKYGDKYE